MKYIIIIIILYPPSLPFVKYPTYPPETAMTTSLASISRNYNETKQIRPSMPIVRFSVVRYFSITHLLSFVPSILFSGLSVCRFQT